MHIDESHSEFFWRKYQTNDLFVFSDIQNFPNDKALQKILFHIIDDMLWEKKQIVFIADQTPSELKQFNNKLLELLNNCILIKSIS